MPNDSLFALLVTVLSVAAPARAAAPSLVTATAAQQGEVKEAIARLKASDEHVEPLRQQPDVSDCQTVLTSDAISVVEVAYVNFERRFFYLSVYNPWTHAQAWYGPFGLAPAAQQQPE